MAPPCVLKLASKLAGSCGAGEIFCGRSTLFDETLLMERLLLIEPDPRDLLDPPFDLLFVIFYGDSGCNLFSFAFGAI